MWHLSEFNLSCTVTKPLEWFTSTHIKYEVSFLIIYSWKKVSSVNLKRQLGIRINKVSTYFVITQTLTQTDPNRETATSDSIQICSQQSTVHTYRFISTAAVLITLLLQQTHCVLLATQSFCPVLYHVFGGSAHCLSAINLNWAATATEQRPKQPINRSIFSCRTWEK